MNFLVSLQQPSCIATSTGCGLLVHVFGSAVACIRSDPPSAATYTAKRKKQRQRAYRSRVMPKNKMPSKDVVREETMNVNTPKIDQWGLNSEGRYTLAFNTSVCRRPRLGYHRDRIKSSLLSIDKTAEDDSTSDSFALARRTECSTGNQVREGSTLLADRM